MTGLRKRTPDEELKQRTLKAALELYVAMTLDMLEDYKNSPADLDDVIEEVENVPIAQQILYEMDEIARPPKKTHTGEGDEEMKLAEQLRQYALEHYNDGGWDVIVECWADEDVDNVLKEEGATTLEQAVEVFRPLVGVWAERQADAENSRF